MGTRNIEHLLENPHFELIEADLLEGDKLREPLEGCSVVYHLAANPDVRIGVTNTNLDFDQNLVATRNVLEAMKDSNHAKTIVFTSTSTVYGDASERPTKEDYGPLVPISLYGATKLGCEALISAYSHLFDFRAVIYRFANVVGPRSSHGVIYDFINKLRKDPSTLEILGDGTQSKSYLYIDDCVDALLSSHQVENQVEIFNVGTNDQVDVQTIANVVTEEMGLKEVKYYFTGGFQGRGWRGDVKMMLLDASKLQRLGWKPKQNSKEAIKLTARSMIKTNLS
jgi:UDP-glucose 4-epimerase